MDPTEPVQSAPPAAASAFAEIHQEIHVGGVLLEQRQGEPLPEGYSDLSTSGTELDQNGFNTMKK